jgi:hypothetical protein
MYEMNCWEFFECGRIPGGDKVKEGGACPAAVTCELNGINNGVHGGRACWAVPGTLHQGKPQGSYTQKLNKCLQCEFHSQVRNQQNSSYIKTREILNILSGKAAASM